MEVTALCVRLLMTALMLLVAHVQPSYPQTSDAAFQIVPTRLQFFEYEPIRFSCEGFNVSAGWKVRSVKESIVKCSNVTVMTAVSCAIDYAFASDSGEYWCEGGGGERSNTVSITVTTGSVILESPVLPVMEGEDVTLRCRNKETSSDLKADFYKDGRLIRSSSTGEMTLHSVSRSDEGLYKCSISGAGGSAESWLAVELQLEIPKCNGSVKQSEDSNTQRTDRTASDKEINFSRHYYILLWIAVTVVLVLQLLVMGLLYWKKQLVLLEVKLSGPNKDMYAVVKKYKKKKDAADNLSLCLDTSHSTKPQRERDEDDPMPLSFHSTFTFTSQDLQNEVSSFTSAAAPSAATDPPLTDEDTQYASIQEITEGETPY